MTHKDALLLGALLYGVGAGIIIGVSAAPPIKPFPLYLEQVDQGRDISETGVEA